MDLWLKLLSTYEGRDKMVRSSFYALLLTAGRMKEGPFVTKLINLSKQLSAARVIGRRWNDLGMINANWSHFQNGLPEKDKLNFLITGAINILYLLYHPVEHVAWLSNLELVPVDSNKWWNYTVYIWAIALVFSILRTIRAYAKLTHARYQALISHGDESNQERALKLQQIEEAWNLLMYVCDLVIAVNYLPKGFLWSQTMPTWKVGACGLLASIIGLVKLLQRLSG